MNKLYEALKKLLPADQVREVAQAVEAMVAEARQEIENEFNSKLNEAYEQISEELAANEATAETGYQQAYEIINGLQLRLEQQKEEFENAMEENYEEAYQMIKAEQSKNNKLELEMYDEMKAKLKQINEFYIDKVDAFLQLQNSEIYEAARKDILSDPRLVEHKVALDRIIDVVGNYVSAEDFNGTQSTKLAEASKAIEDLKGHLRVVEARNVRLSTQNNTLQEQVRRVTETLNESTKTERKERTRTDKNVSGRGSKVMNSDEIIAEFALPQPKKSEDQTLVENNEVLNDLYVLAGLSRE
jgi:DNA anti-recombination protein RmuC